MSIPRLFRLIVLLVPAVTMMQAAANAVLLKSLEFNEDGVLPSSDPEVELFTFGEGVPERDVFSASGGLLRQRTLSNGVNYSYSYPDLNVTLGSIDPAESVALEARLKIVAIQGTSNTQPGAFFQLMDGAAIVHIFFQSDGILVLNHGFIPFDVFEFHTYRIEAEAGQDTHDLLADGVPIAEGIVSASTTRNGFNFGDGGNLSRGGITGADVDWDFIRLFQRVTTVAEPGTLVLLLAGITGLLMIRKLTN